MLKRIAVQHITLGMHVKEFCGSWMDHPFWRAGFTLTDPEDIASIRASAIKEVWIDCHKGRDVESVQAPVLVKAPATVAPPLASPPVQQASVSLAEELQRARQVCGRSKLAVVAMFKQARMGRMVDAASIQRVMEDVAGSVARNATALISLARLKTADDYTYMHSVAVGAMMIALARQLGLDQAQTHLAGIAGLMHDVGKVGIPPALLAKTGRLTEAEFAVVKSHARLGHELLRSGAAVDDVVLDVCLHHHEKFDGSGYPEGLAGDQISLFAKMATVCDVYDAITSKRPYNQAWDPAEALRRMAEWSGDHFDPLVFQAFVRTVGIYPIGSLVRLTSGRLGVVVEQDASSLAAPRVKVFYSTRSSMRIRPELLDLSGSAAHEKIVFREDPRKWNFPDLELMWSGQGGAH